MYFSLRHVESFSSDDSLNPNPNAADGMPRVLEGGLSINNIRTFCMMMFKQLVEYCQCLYVLLHIPMSHPTPISVLFFVVFREASHVPQGVVSFGPPGLSERLPRPCSSLLGATEPALR